MSVSSLRPSKAFHVTNGARLDETRRRASYRRAPRGGARHNAYMRPLTTDLSREEERPYFLWDEDRSVAEFRQALQCADERERYRLIGKLMREARDTDVWRFVTPGEVWAHFKAIEPYLGRRRPFWVYLLTGWHRDGLLS